MAFTERAAEICHVGTLDWLRIQLMEMYVHRTSALPCGRHKLVVWPTKICGRMVCLWSDITSVSRSMREAEKEMNETSRNCENA